MYNVGFFLNHANITCLVLKLPNCFSTFMWSETKVKNTAAPH